MQLFGFVAHISKVCGLSQDIYLSCLSSVSQFEYFVDLKAGVDMYSSWGAECHGMSFLASASFSRPILGPMHIASPSDGVLESVSLLHLLLACLVLLVM